nr:integrase, catalytic region, zinc finger, CCHC-type, peptidase aspartic, catalytic [Tanacetum cinerariifolium]
MLDRTDFASWKQRIRLYYRGKENGVNILKSIDEGKYQIGTVRETPAESTEGAPQFGLEQPRVYSDLSHKEKDRYNADIRATNILLQGLPKDIYTLISLHRCKRHLGQSQSYKTPQDDTSRGLSSMIVDSATTFFLVDTSREGSEANTFTKGSLSTGASGLSSMIMDSATTLCCKLGYYNAEDDGE